MCRQNAESVWRCTSWRVSDIGKSPKFWASTKTQCENAWRKDGRNSVRRTTPGQEVTLVETLRFAGSALCVCRWRVGPHSTRVRGTTRGGLLPLPGDVGRLQARQASACFVEIDADSIRPQTGRHVKDQSGTGVEQTVPPSGVSGAGPPGPYRSKRFGRGDRNRDSTAVWRRDDREGRGGNCCASILPRNRVGNCHQVRRNLSIGIGNRIFDSRPISGHRRRARRCSRVHRNRR